MFWRVIRVPATVLVTWILGAWSVHQLLPPLLEIQAIDLGDVLVTTSLSHLRHIAYFFSYFLSVYDDNLSSLQEAGHLVSLIFTRSVMDGSKKQWTDGWLGVWTRKTCLLALYYSGVYGWMVLPTGRYSVGHGWNEI